LVLGGGDGAGGILTLFQGLFQFGADLGLAGQEVEGLATLPGQPLLAPGLDLEQGLAPASFQVGGGLARDGQLCGFLPAGLEGWQGIRAIGHGLRLGARQGLGLGTNRLAKAQIVPHLGGLSLVALAASFEHGITGGAELLPEAVFVRWRAATVVCHWD
jgi:hypothetical protein